MLGVRPCWETMRLTKCEGESWGEGMEEGRCRLKKEWLKQRHNHFDGATGRVPPVDWSILGAAREASELAEKSYCAEQKRLMEVGEKDELAIDLDALRALRRCWQLRCVRYCKGQCRRGESPHRLMSS